jgi:DNA modification methylase
MLGRKLTKGNTGNLQWGKKYRQAHVEIWQECIRVLKPNGIFILNISDHIRKGEVIPVSNWHKETLVKMGLKHIDTILVETKRMRFGANSHLRVDYENVFVFRK